MLKRIISLLAVVCECWSWHYTGWCPDSSDDFANCHSLLDNATWDGSNPFSDIFDPLDEMIYLNKAAAICPVLNQSVLKEYYECTYGIYNVCVSADRQKLMSGLQNTKASICLLCNQVNDFHFPCTDENTDAFQECKSRSWTPQETNRSTVDGWLANHCSQNPAHIHCMEKAFSHCPGKTAAVAVQLYKYTIPIGCDDGSGSAQRPTDCDNGASTSSKLISTIVPGLMVLMRILGPNL